MGPHIDVSARENVKSLDRKYLCLEWPCVQQIDKFYYCEFFLVYFSQRSTFRPKSGKVGPRGKTVSCLKARGRFRI